MRLHCWRRSEEHLDGIAFAGMDGIIRERRLSRPSCGNCGHNPDLGRLRRVITSEKAECELATFFRRRSTTETNPIICACCHR